MKTFKQNAMNCAKKQAPSRLDHEESNSKVTNILITGNVRHAVMRNGSWNLTTLYRQPVPSGFFNSLEMHGLCLLLPTASDTAHVIGQELTFTAMNTYTCGLIFPTGNLPY